MITSVVKYTTNMDSSSIEISEGFDTVTFILDGHDPVDVTSNRRVDQASYLEELAALFTMAAEDIKKRDW